MSTLGLHSMDYTVTTWPSVTQQFDDFMWSGLGDIDRLDSLGQIDSTISLLYSPPDLVFESKVPILSTTEEAASPDLVFESKMPILSTTEEPDSSTLILSQPLEADQWDDLNTTELSSMLDDPFHSESLSCVSPMSSEYKPYDMVLNLGDNSNVDADEFMEDSLREPVQRLDALASSLNGTSSHQKDTAECILSRDETRIPSTLGEARTGDVGILSPTSYLLDDKIEYALGTAPTASLASCASGVLQSQPSVAQQFDSPQQLAALIADTLETKARRAQASRARRLAASQRRAQGQAKKNPLQKLIRLSSMSKSFRDKLRPSSAISVPAVQTDIPREAFSISGGGQAFQVNQLNQRMAYLPMVIHGSFGIPVQMPLPFSVLSSRPMCLGQQRGHQELLTSYCENQNIASEGIVGRCKPVQQTLETRPVPSNPGSALEIVLLKQLQNVVAKLNEHTRMHIRDSLYRLAKNSKERQWRMDASMSDWKSSCQDMMETQTNPVDRWVANMLFCKPSSASQMNLSPSLHQATEHQMFHARNASEPWNSCASFLNLQDQPLHILTG